MLFSFLNVSQDAELRLRKTKSQKQRFTKRTQKFLAAERVLRFEKSLSVDAIVAGVLRDCVDAVCKLDITKKRVVKVEETQIVKPVVKKPVNKKRIGHMWYTWLSRSYAIFMVLHPEIFNGNAAAASECLGIARSTLLGWVSTNVKRNCVDKWYDIVQNLT